MKTSSIAGYFGSYQSAYASVTRGFKASGKFSIQRAREYRMHPWVLIYYGNFNVLKRDIKAQIENKYEQTN